MEAAMFNLFRRKSPLDAPVPQDPKEWQRRWHQILDSYKDHPGEGPENKGVPNPLPDMDSDIRLQFNFWSTRWKSGPEARRRAFSILPRGDQMLARIEEHLSAKRKPIDADYATMILRKGLDLTRELGIEAPDPFGRVRVMENPTISPQDAFARADSPFMHLRDALGDLAAKENGEPGSGAYYFLSEPLYRLASTYDIAEWVTWPLCSSSDVDHDPTTAAYLLWNGGWSAGWDEDGLFLFDRRREFGLITGGDRSSATRPEQGL